MGWRLEELVVTDTAKAILAGAAGGVVRWATLRHNWREGIGAIAVGALCAIYLGPIVEPLLESTIGKISPHGDPAGFAAFVVGLGGISLTGLILDTIAARFPKKEEHADDDEANRNQP